MTARLEPCLPLDFDEKVFEEVVDKAKDWALMHGACMRSKANFSKDVLQFAPFVLLPSVFPRNEYVKAVELQPLINELIHKIAHNHEFLQDALSVTITVDPFTASLYKIYETVRAEGVTQGVCCGLLRADYLLHSGNAGTAVNSSAAPSVRQVEINTIASSFAGISTHLPVQHQFVLQELGLGEMLDNLPENRALQSLAGGMLKAWQIYGNPKAVILFIIEDVTYNICDQRFHEFEVRQQNPNVRVVRRTLTELGRGGATLGPNKELLVDGLEVAVVYFRSGYAPEQYPSPDNCEWDARLLIERSLAIKCPNIAYHLAGTKKVQQILAKQGVLENLLKDQTKAEKIRECFTGLYSLDLNEEGDAAVELGLSNPENYVLKPQREGGGNNVYGEEVAEVLKKLNGTAERASYILMDLIRPPLLKNWMIRPGAVPQLVDTVSELGIFGVVIGDEKEILVNEAGGHMLRTKHHTANEGGVAAGLGALDSPYLVDL